MYGSKLIIYRLQQFKALKVISATYSNVRFYLKYVPLTGMYGSKLNMCRFQECTFLN
jgi:hypothetical protein